MIFDHLSPHGDEVYHPAMLTLVPTATENTKHHQFIIYYLSRFSGRLMRCADFSSTFPSLPVPPTLSGKERKQRDAIWRMVLKGSTSMVYNYKSLEEVQRPLKDEWLSWANFRQRWKRYKDKERGRLPRHHEESRR